MQMSYHCELYLENQAHDCERFCCISSHDKMFCFESCLKFSNLLLSKAPCNSNNNNNNNNNNNDKYKKTTFWNTSKSD